MADVKWILFYLNIALECDVPILESIFLSQLKGSFGIWRKLNQHKFTEQYPQKKLKDIWNRIVTDCGWIPRCLEIGKVQFIAEDPLESSHYISIHWSRAQNRDFFERNSKNLGFEIYDNGESLTFSSLFRFDPKEKKHIVILECHELWTCSGQLTFSESLICAESYSLFLSGETDYIFVPPGAKIQQWKKDKFEFKEPVYIELPWDDFLIK